MKQIINTIIISAVASLSAMPSMAQVLPDSAKVNVAFRSVEQSALMGGVTAIDVEALETKDYTTYSTENMNALVGGYNGQLWNMGDALVLVDGVPRDDNNVLPVEIASITFMKSAQAVVLFGSRGAKGVVLITTKRGLNQPLKVSVRGNATLNVPKAYPEYLGSAEYMTLYNEALANDGLDPAFSQTDIYHYASGSNPYRYPNTNFFSSDYLKKNYMKYEGVAEFRGGSEWAKYYANVNLYNQDDLINFGEGKKDRVTRLGVRGNIDLKLNQWISGWVNTSATFYDSRNNKADYWGSSATLRPTNPGSAPLVPLIPLEYVGEGDNAWTLINNSNYIVDGKYLLGGTQIYTTNPFAAMYAAGWSKWTSRQFQFDTGLNIDLGALVPGLRFRTQFGVDYASTYTTSISNEYASYEAKWDNAVGKDYITSITKYNLDKSTATQDVSGSTERQTMAFNALFDYTRTFADVHNLYAMLVANGYQLTYSGQYHRTSNTNLGLNVSYNYDQRYYVEFSGAEVYSAKLAEGHRTAFSPTASIGWRINKENFLKDAEWLNELKISTGYAVVNEDLDISDYFMYQDRFTMAEGTWWGWSETNNALQTTNYTRGDNKDLTFVKRKEFTVSLNTALLNNRIRLYADYFNTKFVGQIAIPATEAPVYFQTYWPVSDMRGYYNINDTKRTGFDWGINLSEKFNEVKVDLGFVGLYTTAKNTKWSENVEYDWLKSEGAIADAMRGYQCVGFWNNDEEIAAAQEAANWAPGNVAVVNANTKPGDLKYIDQNGDGIIDSKDNVIIGRWGAPWNIGLNLNVSWKGFTLFAAGHGQFGGNGLKNDTYNWVYGDRKYSAVVRDRWTPETASTATYPRLTTKSGDLNFVTSTFWMYKTDAFFVDKVQLTYDMPQSWFKDKFVSGISLYVYGSSLATISKERKLMERNVGGAPQCRSYNFGFKVNF